MTNAFARKTIAAVAIGAGIVTAAAGDAHAQTREHVLLARQTGVLVQPTADPAAGDDADCWDWTNEDGTTGTTCPGGGGGGGGDRGWIQVESFGWS
jgi:hypothetical protein